MNVYSSLTMKWILFLLSSLAIIGVMAATDEAVSNNGRRLGISSWWHFRRDPCRFAQKITEFDFAITTIFSWPISNGEVKYNYHSSAYSSANFLKDVKLCEDFVRPHSRKPYQIVGTPVTASEFKEAVRARLNSLGINRVFYNIHGFRVNPYDSLNGTTKWTTDEHLIIPIQWKTKWGVAFGASYDIDRTIFAPVAGLELSKAFDVFKDVDYEQSIMCHSMGNFVFRVFAQYVTLPAEPVFNNYFAVAPDQRMDMYSTCFNPEVSGVNCPQPEKLEGMADEEFKLNGGYALSRLAKNIHVVYNWNDRAGAIRELFAIGSSLLIQRCLAKYGKSAEMIMDQYFDDKVMFHDFTNGVPDIEKHFGHSYHWYPNSTALYEDWTNKDISSV